MAFYRPNHWGMLNEGTRGAMLEPRTVAAGVATEVGATAAVGPLPKAAALPTPPAGEGETRALFVDELNGPGGAKSFACGIPELMGHFFLSQNGRISVVYLSDIFGANKRRGRL